MKNPLLTIIALLVLAGVLFAQSFPPGGGAHPIIRKIELVGPIQVEGIVPLRNHISMEWAAPPGTPFIWTCPAGTHARVTLIAGNEWATSPIGTNETWSAQLHLAAGPVAYIAWGGVANYEGALQTYRPREVVLHPGDSVQVSSANGTVTANGILQLAVEYD